MSGPRNRYMAPVARHHLRQNFFYKTLYETESQQVYYA